MPDILKLKTEHYNFEIEITDRISHNKIISLDNLPSNLQILRCVSNKIHFLNNLPLKLKYLYCCI